MRTTRRLSLLALATATALGALAAAPAGAAPAAITHAVVVNPDPVNHTPHVLDGRTEAVVEVGGRVLVGGEFTQVKRWSKPEIFTRTGLFAYDKATGAVDPTFNPDPGAKVTALLPAPDGKVFVAGQFKTISGVSRPYLAKIDPVTGAVDPTFLPTVNGFVFDMHLANGRLHIGGSFTKVRNLVRTNLAIVDVVTGKAVGADLPFTGAPKGVNRVLRLDITPDGSKLVAVGNFATVGGQSRPNVAILDLDPNGSASVSPWRTDMYRYGVCGTSYDTFIYDVDIAPAGGWFVIVTTGGPKGTTTLCDTAARWEITADPVAQTTWRNYTGGDSLTSVAITGPAVYVAGHHRWLDNPYGKDSAGAGAVSRPGIGAIDPVTGKALSWNPTRDRGLRAMRLVPTPDGLYVLSDSNKFFGEYHPRLSYLPVAGGSPA